MKTSRAQAANCAAPAAFKKGGIFIVPRCDTGTRILQSHRNDYIYFFLR